MFGQFKATFVLLCLLVVTPTSLQKKAKCKKPTGKEGDVYVEGCTAYTCTKAQGNKGIWVDRPDLDGCCFNDGTGYPVGETVDVTVADCTETTVVCEKKDGHMASPMSYSACTCFQDILAEVEENGEGLQEIMDVLDGGSGGGGGSVGGGSGGESGVIQTPNYPDFYPASYYEEWNLEVSQGKQIKLTFEGFYIEPPICEYTYYSGEGYDWEMKDMSKKGAQDSKTECGDCYYDYVSISYGSVEEKYCGYLADDMPDPIISSGNTMTVVFSTDSTVQYKGFKATWEAV